MFSRIFRKIQGYWWKFSHPFMCWTREEREGLPCSFWKSNKCPDFGKKGSGFEVPLSKGPSSTPSRPSLAFCKTLHLKCLTVIIFSTLFFFQVYSGIVNYIRHYLGILTHSETLRHIQAYSAKFSTVYNPRHILSPGIFKTGSLFKILRKVDQVYSELCYRTLLNHI